VFDNDFSALLPNGPRGDESEGQLFQMEAETGRCRVICFSPRHDLTLPEMPVADIRKVVDMWAEQMAVLGKEDGINYVQLFENKGEVMGCSNPHPHGQVWANYRLPQLPAQEDRRQREYYQDRQSPLLVDYVNAEIAAQERIVAENADWVALVPFWAVWPFETMLLPRRHVVSLTELRDEERDSLAQIMQRLLTRYDNLFETSFPYSMGWHGQPTDGTVHHYWHLHAHFFPPLLRSATVKKFMVGYEMLANGQRDITAEQAAQRLRDVSDVHYKTEA
jgi:UDPglucose--hexose-1-phosphate uridylyltransferase